RGSIIVSAVNLPFEDLQETARPHIELAEKLGLFAAQILSSPVNRVVVEMYGGEKNLEAILTLAVLKGLLTPHAPVNFVNAEQIAELRGIESRSEWHPTPHDYANLLTFRASSGEEEISVCGTVFSEKNLRVVSVNDFRIEFKPEGHLLHILNKDVPGVVGRVGGTLGAAGINIAEYNLARNTTGGTAMSLIAIDSPLDDETLNELRNQRGIIDVKQVKL
ncbi:MAG TPA: phosphoglycerate dehydrogenase, partial [Thermoanaerobaculia bacterium]|nr:phosphoglycerate dehydrogenase [Thermoanaerobaculia bacterium]